MRKQIFIAKGYEVLIPPSNNSLLGEDLHFGRPANKWVIIWATIIRGFWLAGRSGFIFLPGALRAPGQTSFFAGRAARARSGFPAPRLLLGHPLSGHLVAFRLFPGTAIYY